MKDILEALSVAAPNVERKLYTILTGNDIGKKILTENGELCRQICFPYIGKNWKKHRIKGAFRLQE